MGELKNLIIFGICAAMLVRLSGGTQYGRYVRFLGQLLLFAQIVGVCVGLFHGDKSLLWEQWEQASKEIDMRLAGDPEEGLQERSEDILEQISEDAVSYWEKEQEKEAASTEETRSSEEDGQSENPIEVAPIAGSLPVEVIVGGDEE